MVTMKEITEQDIAADIYKQIDKLNSLLAQACTAGLQVDVDVMSAEVCGKPTPLTEVKTRVSKVYYRRGKNA